MSWKTFLVDDDTISALLTQHLLKLHHFSNDITTFYQAEEALEYLLNNISGPLPDLILLDLNMPVMSGWDFLSALEPYLPALQTVCKVFILTSSLENADELKSKEYPLVAGFIQKPIRPADIQIILAEMNKSKSNEVGRAE